MKHNKIYVPKKRKKNVTICIASICNRVEEGYLPAIVFCADRLLSSGVTFEHGNPKIKIIPDRAIVMEAGDATTSDLIIDKEVLSIETGKLDLKQIAEKINDNIISLRTKLIDNNVLSKFGLNFNDLATTEIPPTTFRFIMDEIKKIEEDIDLEFILAGFDKDGSPHLFKISSNNGVQCMNSVGFVNSGSGGILSLIEMTKSEHSNSILDSEAILKVYSAKKSAERVAGVGRKTDLGVLFLVNSEKEGEYNVGRFIFPEDFKKLLDKELLQIKSSEAKIKQTIKAEIDARIRPKQNETEENEMSEE